MHMWNMFFFHSLFIPFTRGTRIFSFCAGLGWLFPPSRGTRSTSEPCRTQGLCGEAGLRKEALEGSWGLEGKGALCPHLLGGWNLHTWAPARLKCPFQALTQAGSRDGGAGSSLQRPPKGLWPGLFIPVDRLGLASRRVLPKRQEQIFCSFSHLLR